MNKKLSFNTLSMWSCDTTTVLQMVNRRKKSLILRDCTGMLNWTSVPLLKVMLETSCCSVGFNGIPSVSLENKYNNNDYFLKKNRINLCLRFSINITVLANSIKLNSFKVIIIVISTDEAILTRLPKA